MIQYILLKHLQKKIKLISYTIKCYKYHKLLLIIIWFSAGVFCIISSLQSKRRKWYNRDNPLRLQRIRTALNRRKNSRKSYRQIHIHLWRLRKPYKNDGNRNRSIVQSTGITAKYSFTNGRKTAYEYYLKNAHGDVVGITDDTGAVKKIYRYDAFGVCDY